MIRRNLAPLAVALALVLATPASHAARFVYEGRLDDAGRAAEGRYDLKLTAYGDATHGSTLAAPVTLTDVEVRDGRFRIDVDLPLVESDQVWLEVAVRGSGEPTFASIPGRSKAVAATLIGQCWSTTGDSGSNPATNFLGTTDAQAFVVRTANARSLQIEPSALSFGQPALPITSNLLGGSSVNALTAGVRGATIAGGGVPADTDPDVLFEGPNRVTDHYGTIGGGYGNRAGDDAGTLADALGGTVAGGVSNAAGRLGTVSGGSSNRASANGATVAGGGSNAASGPLSAVGGGLANTASGEFSSVSAGNLNCAGGRFSWAGGRRAKVRPGSASGDAGLACPSVPVAPAANGDEGTFVWADATGVDFLSTGPNQFNIRAQGGVGINTPPRDLNVELTVRGRVGDAFGGNPDVELIVDNANQEGIQFGASDGGVGSSDANFEIAHKNATSYFPRLTLFGSGAVTIRSNTTAANTGVTMAANAGSWSSLSDRNLKTAIAPVDANAVLARVIDLPMATWSYIAQGEAIRHMGPMAQDFAAAFGLGENDTTIATIGADGVALAAIQGLNAKLEAENAALRDDLDTLRAELAALRAAIGAPEANGGER